ncbi:MAG: ABC transporter ATP-binding protein [Candidatus Cloacimonetes bacterium]|jgi:lipoprotein-releasing system ATP-binding protein|nr:ABC transporter ATP-binding protein [Candidatus Cloacimonadota bacterium]
MEILRSKSLVKNYQDVNSVLHILKGIDFSVNQSDLISVSGSSGSGKSTLLHILGLLDSPTSGEVYYFNRLISNKDKDLSDFRNQHIGFVFQFHYLLNDFTAVENVAIPMYISGKTWKKSLTEAAELLVKMDMYDRLNHYPNQLSGGEQQRTAIARALINRPDVIFADEPTGNLDFNHAQEIINLILQLNQKYGQTFIIATHDQNVCENMKIHYKLEKGEMSLTS